jgi:hypothetical protein
VSRKRDRDIPIVLIEQANECLPMHPVPLFVLPIQYASGPPHSCPDTVGTPDRAAVSRLSLRLIGEEVATSAREQSIP